MRPLTAVQAETLAFIRSEIASKGRPPTIRELGAHFGVSSCNAVACRLDSLRRKGAIAIDRSVARGIRVLGDPEVKGPTPERVAELIAAAKEYDAWPTGDTYSRLRAAIRAVEGP